MVPSTVGVTVTLGITVESGVGATVACGFCVSATSGVCVIVGSFVLFDFAQILILHLLEKFFFPTFTLADTTTIPFFFNVTFAVFPLLDVLIAT